MMLRIWYYVGPCCRFPLITIPNEARVYLALAVPVVVWFQELRDQYADWRVRQMAQKVEAELREDGFFDRRSS